MTSRQNTRCSCHGPAGLSHPPTGRPETDSVFEVLAQCWTLSEFFTNFSFYVLLILVVASGGEHDLRNHANSEKKNREKVNWSPRAGD